MNKTHGTHAFPSMIAHTRDFSKPSVRKRLFGKNGTWFETTLKNIRRREQPEEKC